MAALGNQSIASSYEQLLHVDRDGGGNTTTLVDVKDGDNGPTFALKLATDKVQVVGELNIDQDATSGTAINIDTETQDGQGIYMDVSQQTSGYGININDVGNSRTTGGVLYINSRQNNRGTRNLVEFKNDHVGATGATVLKIQQDAAQYGMAIDQNGNANAIRIDSDATTNVGAIQAHVDSLTTGRIAYFYSNSSDTSTRGLVKIVNDHTSATGTTALEIQQDSTGLAIHSTGDVLATGGLNTGTDMNNRAIISYDSGALTLGTRVSSANYFDVLQVKGNDIGLGTSVTSKTHLSSQDYITVGQEGQYIVGSNTSTLDIAISNAIIQDTSGNYEWAISSVPGSVYKNRFGFHEFLVSNGTGTAVDDVTLVSAFKIANTGAVEVTGALSKGSGSFKIDHPLDSKKDTHHLVHSFVESPQANNIYRGKINLVSGTATINLDTVSNMTDGTFVLLNTDIQCFTTNESDWDNGKGSVSGNKLTISCQNTDSSATISWMVIGERQDKHIMETNWTDENGKVIVEPLKSEE